MNLLLDCPEEDEERLSDAVLEEFVEKAGEPTSEQLLGDGFRPPEEQLGMRSTFHRCGDQIRQERLEDIRAILETSWEENTKS